MARYRRPKGWWLDYRKKLDAFCAKARDTSLVTSDGDRELSMRVYHNARQRYYWYEAGIDGRGNQVYFCWTLHKAEDGTYASWREVHYDRELKRYDYAYRKTKAKVAEIARRRYNAFINKDAPPEEDESE